ncbi:MAG TPA: hypothetical protein VJ927_04785 [Actinomycetota bacterium]|nr:hypothetical protein [Actinomycetota bacterium]
MKNTLGSGISAHKRLGAALGLAVILVLMAAPVASARPVANSADPGSCTLDRQVLKNEPGICSYTGSVAEETAHEHTSPPAPDSSGAELAWVIGGLAVAALVIGGASTTFLRNRPHQAA